MPYREKLMAKSKEPKLAVNEVRDGHFVKSWKENREWVVQVWLNKPTPDGEPEGDWSYPGVLGVDVAVSQGVLDTKSDAERNPKKK